MIRSLRLRFFLITWPLVVGAVGVVALTFGRWTRVELQVLETLEPPVSAAHSELAGRLADEWERAGNAAGLRSTLARLAAPLEPPADLVVVDPAGSLVAATDPGVTLAGAPRRDGLARFTRSRVTDGVREEQELGLDGIPIRSGSGALLGTLYVMARTAPPFDEATAALREDARRTLWTAFLVASGAAALAALLLAGPLVRQVRGLADAAAAVRDGALRTRVRGSGADELGQLERSFNAMAEALERADAQQRNLIGDVAHELRTPLTNIAGTLEAIEDGLAASDETTLASLREEVDRLARLVEQLQELTLAEAGQLTYDLETVDVVEESTAAAASMSAASRGVTLNGPGGSAPVHARADRERLAQVLRNLLRNALTHTPEGGVVSIEVEPREPAGVAIRVRDTGPGIPAEHLPLVWERFHRVDPARGRASGGMGLGLALVRQHVRGMGGRVAALSPPGEGAMFEVVLPRAERPPASLKSEDRGLS